MNMIYILLLQMRQLRLRDVKVLPITQLVSNKVGI